MFNFLKSQQPTPIELVNEDAGRAYAIREGKKFIARKIVFGTAALAAIGTAAYVLSKKLENDLPLED